jgi:hypothetical protein
VRPRRPPAVELVPAQQHEVLLARAPLPLVPQLVVQPRELRAVAGDVQHAVLGDVGVDALCGGDRDHLVDRSAHRGEQVEDALAAMGRRVGVA